MPARKKFQPGEFVVRQDGQVRQVLEFTALFRGSIGRRRKRGFYTLTGHPGYCYRTDHVKPFRGMVMTGEAWVLVCGRPQHGILVLTGGRPSLVPWRGRPAIRVLRRWPAVARAIAWLRKDLRRFPACSTFVLLTNLRWVLLLI